MNYFLIKLAFDGPVHFGPSESAQALSVSADHVLADTLFSALCHTASQMYGSDSVTQLGSWAKEGSLLLSDTMPWHGEDFFLPKPCVIAEHRGDLPKEQVKAMKKMDWIPVLSMGEFSQSVHGGPLYDPKKHAIAFGFHTEVTRAATPYGEDATPYQVGLYQFMEECGLYFLAGLKTAQQEQLLLSLLNGLGLSGLGGKTSSGCGRFHVEDSILLNEYFDEQTQWLYESLTQASERSLLVTSSLPRDDELTQSMVGAAYQMIRRAGFVSSDTYAPAPLKKKTQYFLKAGAVLARRFEGDLYSVGGCGSHPVFRYSKPMFLGVNL